MVVGFHLHQGVDGGVTGAVDLPFRARLDVEALGGAAFHDRGVVRVGNHGAFRLRRMCGADHAEQGVWLVSAVDFPLRVEDLVSAMLAVGLREHHQLNISRVASEPGEGLNQIGDFIIGQRQAHGLVGVFQRLLSLLDDRDGLHRLAFQRGEQCLAAEVGINHRFRHPVMQGARQRGQVRLSQGLARAQQATLDGHRVQHAALDAAHILQAAVVGNVSGLAGPGRQGAQARHRHQLLALQRLFNGFAIAQQAIQALEIGVGKGLFSPDEVDKLRRHILDRRMNGLQPLQQPLATKRRKC